MIQQFDSVLNYIEENLYEELNYSEISRLAGCNIQVFQKMFSFITGYPLSEYIRRRKISNAVFDLLDGKKIIEVSIKCGYSSPTAFNRAFHSVIGFPPSDVKTQKNDLKLFPKLHLKLSVSGDESIQYRIEEKAELTFIGKSYFLSTDMNENFQNVPLFWESFEKNDSQRLTGYGDLNCIYGIAAYQDNTTYKYYICIAEDFKNKKNSLTDFDTLVVPPQVWLVLTSKGDMPDTMQNMYRKFYKEWLPISNYTYDVNADIEVYPTNQEKECELWLPIKRKEN